MWGRGVLARLRLRSLVQGEGRKGRGVRRGGLMYEGGRHGNEGAFPNAVLQLQQCAGAHQRPHAQWAVRVGK